MEKRERLKTTWEPAPSPERRGFRAADGILTESGPGFCFRMKDGKAQYALGELYTRDALAMSAERRVTRRIRTRDGKQVKDTVKSKHGAVSIVATTPPWSWGLIGKLLHGDRDDLMLRLATASAEEIKRVSKRDLFGGGAHYEANADKSFFPHFHFHIPKAPAPGHDGPVEAHPKEAFINLDSWTLSAHRLEKTFPGLLSRKKVEWLHRNLQKKGRREIVDIAIQDRIDQELDAYFSQMGLSHHYSEEKRRYRSWKTKEDKTQATRKLTKSALSYFDATGVWPIARKLMSLAMWRMIPADLRGAVMLCIRAKQAVRNPARAAVGIMLRAAKLAMQEPPIPQPRI